MVDQRRQSFLVHISRFVSARNTPHTVLPVRPSRLPSRPPAPYTCPSTLNVPRQHGCADSPGPARARREQTPCSRTPPASGSWRAGTHWYKSLPMKVSIAWPDSACEVNAIAPTDESKIIHLTLRLHRDACFFLSPRSATEPSKERVSGTCPERDCGRRRRQKCTLFTRTIVGLIEPVHLVEVRSADDIASPADAPSAIAPQCESREGRPGSHVCSRSAVALAGGGRNRGFYGEVKKVARMRRERHHTPRMYHRRRTRHHSATPSAYSHHHAHIFTPNTSQHAHFRT